MSMTQLGNATRRARKQHRCDMCNAIIQPGRSHHVQTNVYDNHIYDFRTCQSCERDKVVIFVIDWCDPDEGATYEGATEWAPEAAAWSKDGCERWAARSWLARAGDGEGE